MLTLNQPEEGTLTLNQPETGTLTLNQPEEGTLTLNQSEEGSLTLNQSEEGSLTLNQPETGTLTLISLQLRINSPTPSLQQMDHRSETNTGLHDVTTSTTKGQTRTAAAARARQGEDNRPKGEKPQNATFRKARMLKPLLNIAPGTFAK